MVNNTFVISHRYNHAVNFVYVYRKHEAANLHEMHVICKHISNIQSVITITVFNM